MLITFTTDAHANVTLFGDVALTLLKMMGNSGAVPGAILAADVPAALARLTAAIKDEQEPLQPNDDPSNDDDREPEEVSLKNRALPLLNLLGAAARAESNVMWE